MLLNYYGRHFTPVDVQNELDEKHGYRLDATRNLVNWPQLPAVFPDIRKITRQDFLSRDPLESELSGVRRELGLGHPVILKVDGVPSTNEYDEHFVLAIQSLESGIIVADPYSGQFKPLTDFCNTHKPWRKTEAAAIWAIIYAEMALV